MIRYNTIQYYTIGVYERNASWRYVNMTSISAMWHNDTIIVYMKGMRLNDTSIVYENTIMMAQETANIHQGAHEEGALLSDS